MSTLIERMNKMVEGLDSEGVEKFPGIRIIPSPHLEGNEFFVCVSEAMFNQLKAKDQERILNEDIDW